MPLYPFHCDECGRDDEVVRPMADSSKPLKCTCGKQMRRVFTAKSGNHDYAVPIVSHSMAVTPRQIAEHKRLFPDVKITKDGCPILENYKQHDNYLKARGFSKLTRRDRCA